MGLTVNLLSSDDWTLNGDSIPSLWTSSSATLATTKSEYKNSGYGSIEVSPSANACELRFNNEEDSLTALTTMGNLGGKLESFVWCRSTVSATIQPIITITRQMTGTPVDDVDRFTVNGDAFYLTSGEWTLIRTLPISVPLNPSTAHYHIKIVYEISGSSLVGEKLYFHFPTVYDLFAMVDNQFVSDCWRYIPNIFQSSDTELPLPSYPLFRLMEIAYASHGVINAIASQMTYIDISDGKDTSNSDTLSILVQPSRIPREYIFWVSQFTGTQLINPTTGTTPWANLPASWNGIDLIDSDDDPNDAVPWGDLQQYAPEIAGLDDFFRWQVATGFYGYAAGSIAAIREATKRVLGGTKTCTITKNYLSSPWKIKIQTKLAETPDATTIGQSIDEILSLMEPARPLGVILTHEIIA